MKTRGDSDEYRDDRPSLHHTLTCSMDDWIVNGWRQKPCRAKCTHDSLRIEGYHQPDTLIEVNQMK